MPIKTPPQHNTKNPPGQIVNDPHKEFKRLTGRDYQFGDAIPRVPNEDWKPPRYLRDVIIAAQDRASETFPGEPATQGPTDAEKRLERLKQALLAACRSADGVALKIYGLENSGSVTTDRIRKLLEENAWHRLSILLQ